MLDRKEAVERVSTLLKEQAPPDQPWMISEPHTREIETAWIFFYNSKRYLETGEVMYALAGNGPVFVNKRTGETKFYGAIPPLQTVIEEYEKTTSAGV